MLGRPDCRIPAELSNAGFGLLLCAGVMLGAVILMLAKAGPLIATGMMVGGMAGLVFTLLVPGNPARLGYRFARFPKQLSPHEQELTAHVARLRKPWLMALASTPYLLGLLAYTLMSRQPPRVTDLGSQFLAGFFSMLYVAAVTWGVQFLQVLWSLRRESRAGRREE